MPPPEPTPPEPQPPHLQAEAQRWVRRLRILYTILGIYAALSLMWLAIDIADGTENLWFYSTRSRRPSGIAVSRPSRAGASRGCVSPRCS
jgi:hypothetical protein